MNINQMHLAVKLGLDKTEGLSYAAFEVEEIDWWLNECIDRFIKTRYSGVNVKREGFEQSQKRTDDLRTLVKEVRLASPASTGISDKPNLYIAALPADYLLFLNDEVSIFFTNEVIGGDVELRTYPLPITSNDYSAKINDPYSEHRLHMNTARPLRMITSKGVELITDGSYSVVNYFLKYLRKPVTVVYASTDCDLPEHTHREIVNLTVKVLAGNIESQGYSVETAELAQNE